MDAPKHSLDPAIIAELSALLGGDLTPLAESFTADSRCRLDAIAAGLECGDAERVRTEAHSLKGAASSIGAFDLASLCGELEQHMRAGETPPAELPRAIEAERRSVCSDLSSLAATSR